MSEMVKILLPKCQNTPYLRITSTRTLSIIQVYPDKIFKVYMSGAIIALSTS